MRSEAMVDAMAVLPLELSLVRLLPSEFATHTSLAPLRAIAYEPLKPVLE